MMQWIWGPIKTGSYACAHSDLLLWGSFTDYGFNWARNSVLLCCHIKYSTILQCKVFIATIMMSLALCSEHSASCNAPVPINLTFITS